MYICYAKLVLRLESTGGGGDKWIGCGGRVAQMMKGMGISVRTGFLNM